LEAGDAAVRNHALENVAWKPTRSTRHQTRRRDSDIITGTHICMRLGEINNKKYFFTVWRFEIQIFNIFPPNFQIEKNKNW
jgi:hypothetical protein